MSRPCASVPNGNSQEGGSSAFIRLASITGSVSAIHGASTAAPSAIATRLPPTHVLAPHFMPVSSVADARVDDDVGEIDQCVDEKKEYHDHQNAALDGRDVALEHGVDQQRADTRPREQFLDHYRLAHQRPELQADDGDDQHQGIAQHMPFDDS